MSTYGSMKSKDIYYRTKLPHIHPADGIFFITFRLADSLPIQVIHQFMEEKNFEKLRIRLQYEGILKKELLYEIEKNYFNKFDKLLSMDTTNCWLNQDKIAQLIANKLHSYDKHRYLLICYCIMPNHVHMLVNMKDFISVNTSNRSGRTRYYPLTNVLRLMKGSTARIANKMLDRSGAFWQHESYDHYVRSENEYNKIIEYILQNPVKSGIVTDWRDWKWNYLANL